MWLCHCRGKSMSLCIKKVNTSSFWRHRYATLCHVQRIKTDSRGLFSHSTRLRANLNSHLKTERPRDLTYCLYKYELMVTINPDGSELIHKTWENFNVSPLVFSTYIKRRICCYSNICFACYSLCYVMWCPITTTMSVIKGRCAPDALPLTYNIGLFKYGKRILPQQNILAMNL